jgi:hypothetical protein
MLNKKLNLCLFNYLYIIPNILYIPTSFVKIEPKSIVGISEIQVYARLYALVINIKRFSVKLHKCIFSQTRVSLMLLLLCDTPSLPSINGQGSRTVTTTSAQQHYRTGPFRAVLLTPCTWTHDPFSVYARTCFCFTVLTFLSIRVHHLMFILSS